MNIRTNILSALSCALLASTLMVGGCIVHATSTTGVLEVRWDNSAAACYGIDGVRVRVKRGGQLYDESPRVDCSKGFHAFSLQPGYYDVNIVGLDGANTVVQYAGIDGLRVESDTNILSPVLKLQSGAGGTAGLTANWTIAGMKAAQGCTKLDISMVTVTAFDSKLAKIVAQSKVNCTLGKVTLSNVPVGQVWLQIDAVDSSDHAFYGNANVIGPIQITAKTTSVLGLPEDIIDLRASIDIPWQFANGKTCGGNGVSSVMIEIRRPGGDVLVPLNAADANKACDLGKSNTMVERAIDLQFVNPTCKIPAGADGLVLCGIMDRNLDVRAVTVDEVGGALKFGGWLKIRDLQPGVFTNNNKPLYLESCNSNGVDCSVK